MLGSLLFFALFLFVVGGGNSGVSVKIVRARIKERIEGLDSLLRSESHCQLSEEEEEELWWQQQRVV